MQSLEISLTHSEKEFMKFNRHIGIDYSGAESPESRIKGLQVYVADRNSEPVPIRPELPARNWSRKEVAHWLLAELQKDESLLIGMTMASPSPRAISSATSSIRGRHSWRISAGTGQPISPIAMSISSVTGFGGEITRSREGSAPDRLTNSGFARTGPLLQKASSSSTCRARSQNPPIQGFPG